MAGIKLQKAKNESGVVIVEASFVFPIMFIVLFFLIYMGNAFYEKAQIEAVVAEQAVRGAGYCADPLLQTLKETGSLPSVKMIKTEPYRNLFGGMDDIEMEISREVKQQLGGNAASFFRSMKPKIVSNQVEYHNYVVYSTFSVEVNYEIHFPVRLWGDPWKILSISSRAEAPVSDTVEFIRNTDMAIDMFSGTKAGKAISDMFGKVNDFISKFASK